MKDKKLEEQFGKYFYGAEIPENPNNITEDAKKALTKRGSGKRGTRLNKFVKIASVAASATLVVAIGAVLLTRAYFPANSEIPAPDIYEASELVYTDENPYTVSQADGALKFLEELAYSPNAEISAYTSRFADGEKAHVFAKATYISGARYDAEIFVEYSDGVFSPLESYKDGEKGKYRGTEYYLTAGTAENGEPEYKLFTEIDGVKYYFRVTSSDTSAYLKCLDLILN